LGTVEFALCDEFIVENPGIFEKAVGTLPDGAFRESNGNGKRKSNTDSKSNSKRKQEDILADLRDQEFNQDQAKRTDAIALGHLKAGASMLQRDLILLQQQQTAGMEKLSEAYSPVTQTQKWKEHRNRKAAREEEEDEDTPEPYAYLMDDIDYNNVSIQSVKEGLKEVKEEIAKKQGNKM
jgi:hypothetical protein